MTRVAQLRQKPHGGAHAEVLPESYTIECGVTSVGLLKAKEARWEEAGRVRALKDPWLRL